MIEQRHIQRLWVKMAQIYGHKWTSSFGDADDGTWLAGLRNLTPEQLANGVARCIASHEPWPPGLPEFRGMCLNIPNKQVVINNIRRAVQQHRLTELDGLERTVAQEIGSYNLGALSGRESVMRIGAAYDAVLDDMQRQTTPELRVDTQMAELAASAIKRAD